MGVTGWEGGGWFGVVFVAVLVDCLGRLSTYLVSTVTDILFGDREVSVADCSSLG